MTLGISISFVYVKTDFQSMIKYWTFPILNTVRQSEGQNSL
jgi:hypothetical protein